MTFKDAVFIKPDINFNRADSLAPMFRKTFVYNSEIQSANISFCVLGFGYVYINGRCVTEDKFLSPYSDYRKTLWYSSYDVTEYLKNGENVISVICGNGWYNENMRTVWTHSEADWRDLPKVILELSVNGKCEVCTDKSWIYSLNSPVTYNELRSGENFDSRIYDAKWNTLDYDDSGWESVKEDDTPPAGTFRLCECEPVRECEIYAPKKMYKVSDDKVIYDFGQNISGYVRLYTNQTSGDRITLRHVEEIGNDLSLIYNQMDDPYYYPDTPFQEDEFICCGKEFVYSPLFTYHGFRYVEITGLKNPSLSNVTGVFVHQDVKRSSHFECSNHMLNALFDAGIMSTWSNMHYALTDCPTREKMGWTNDAQSSADQVLTNFNSKKFFEKWMQDIFDAMRDDGALPGIVPTPHWGYDENFCGPVADGAIFEIPYRIYKNTGDDKLLKKAYPYFVRYLSFVESLKDEKGDILYGLGDWASPSDDVFDSIFPNAMLIIKFMRIKKLAEELLDIDTKDTTKRIEETVCNAKKKYLLSDGRCVTNKQTSVAMMIYFDIYDDIVPLKNQLEELVKNANYHHDCGMLGIRYLYYALCKCGLTDIAFKIITAEGYPSYNYWFERDMTTMFEFWDGTTSRNHHMLSDVMMWMMKYILGIKQKDTSVAYKEVEIKPEFFDELTYAKGNIDTVSGKISVSWEKLCDNILVKIDVPESMKVYYKGKLLNSGHNEFYES